MLSKAYMCRYFYYHWIMASRLASAKPLSEPLSGILSIGPLRTNLSEFFIRIITLSLKKMCLKVSSAKWRPFCLSLNVLPYFPKRASTIIRASYYSYINWTTFMLIFFKQNWIFAFIYIIFYLWQGKVHLASFWRKTRTDLCYIIDVTPA